MTGITVTIRPDAIAPCFASSSEELWNLSFSCSSRTKALTTRIPIRFSCTTRLTLSTFFCIFWNIGKPNFIIRATITMIIGSIIRSVADILGLILTAITAATTKSAGPLTRIRSDIITTFWSIVISFVSLVVSEAVENSSIFLNEKLLIFLYTSFLSLYAKRWLTIAEAFIVPIPPQRPIHASPSIAKPIFKT